MITTTGSSLVSAPSPQRKLPSTTLDDSSPEACHHRSIVATFSRMPSATRQRYTSSVCDWSTAIKGGVIRSRRCFEVCPADDHTGLTSRNFRPVHSRNEYAIPRPLCARWYRPAPLADRSRSAYDSPGSGRTPPSCSDYCGRQWWEQVWFSNTITSWRTSAPRSCRIW